MIYFVILLTIIIGISFIVWYVNRQDNNPDTPVRPFLNGVSKVNIKPLREDFLDNYMWACEVFGVGKDIRGEGKIKGQPWRNYRDQIVKVVIEDGITGIGEEAFYFCTKLREISIPDTVTEMEVRIFYSCSSLKTALIDPWPVILETSEQCNVRT